jgi:hypothetical protein
MHSRINILGVALMLRRKVLLRKNVKYGNEKALERGKMPDILQL